jgi:uncharacterized phage-associated protein
MADLIPPGIVANYLLAESRERGEVLTNLKLQKLLYYAQAWHLALNDAPIFGEDFQAWVHGPVLPSQYFRFRDFQWRPITTEFESPDLANSGMKKFLSEIIDIFGSETAVSLELMTHREAPWVEARGKLAPYELSTNGISKHAMKEFYRSLGAN